MKLKFLTLSAMFALTTAAQAQGLDWKAARFYLGAEVGQSLTHMDSGGFNTAGGFKNTNDDNDRNSLYGIKAGVDMGRLRFDLGYKEYARGKYTTDSCSPPGAIAF